MKRRRTEELDAAVPLNHLLLDVGLLGLDELALEESEATLARRADVGVQVLLQAWIWRQRTLMVDMVDKERTGTHPGKKALGLAELGLELRDGAWTRREGEAGSARGAARTW